MKQPNEINGSWNERHAGLSRAIRNGDEASFVAYYDAHILYIASVAQKITSDRHEAWDIAQDTFTKLWQQREAIDPEKSLDAFVARMAVNAALNARARKQTHQRYHAEQMNLQYGGGQSADADLIAREVQQKIDTIVGNMPPQRRLVFTLSREENLTYNEIAQRMGLSPGTVHRHMSIALKELRNLTSALAFIIISTSV